MPSLLQLQIPTTHLLLKLPATHSTNHISNNASTQNAASPSIRFNNNNNLLRCTMFPLLSIPLSSLAAESQQILSSSSPPSSKISIESLLVSVDDFFNRNPFFVAGLTFVWLVVVPLAQEYLKKCKFVSAIDAFRKLRDAADCQLLDIRRRQSVAFMGSPNLRILNKSAVQVEYREGDEEEGFVKEVLKNFKDPGNTIICVLDNFDGNSLKVAELLFKNGFKEAYAIKGGLRGKDGWQAIQETLLPPSVNVFPRKKKSKSSSQLENRQEINGQPPNSPNIHLEEGLDAENGSVKPMETAPKAELAPKKPSSPYPNYSDLKPPSSPTPSKPQT